MTSVLGGMPPALFLRDHWQKRPLLIRQALPGFGGILDRDALLRLATRGDVISRLVLDHASTRPRRRSRWERHDGPFGELDARLLPESHWTVLVHGVESLVPGGWELLRRFDFLPAARIDDLMVSYAAPGGSVGPHDDRYDVFLLQGPGRRRWQISESGDRAVDATAAIKVLASFVPEQEWVLDPGDMLYLPPGVAHHGVAEGPCFTYSIGFLAPSHIELVQSFLGYLGGALGQTLDDPDALLADPDLALPDDPLAVSDAMVAQVRATLRAVRWEPALEEQFVGCFLTRPKPHVVFAPPRRPLSIEAFARRLRERGRLALALPTRALLREDRLFLNGEAHRLKPAPLKLFHDLALHRILKTPLPAAALGEDALELLYGFYLAGYLEAVAVSGA